MSAEGVDNHDDGLAGVEGVRRKLASILQLSPSRRAREPKPELFKKIPVDDDETYTGVAMNVTNKKKETYNKEERTTTGDATYGYNTFACASCVPMDLNKNKKMEDAQSQSLSTHACYNPLAAHFDLVGIAEYILSCGSEQHPINEDITKE